MKMSSLIALVIMSSLALSSPLAGAQFQRGAADRVCVYQDIHYQGWEQCYSPGDEVSNLRGRGNNISSIRIYGRARVIVFEESNFRGNSDEYNFSVPDLGLRHMNGSRSWSDRIESLIVGFSGGGRPGVGVPGGRGAGGGPGRGAGYGRGQDNGFPGYGRGSQNSRDGVCVYERPHFQGRSDCWSIGEDLRDLGRASNWSDRISSVRIFGRAVAVFYRDIGFNGERLVIDRDIADLGQIRSRGFGSWDDQVSSFQIHDQRGGRYR